VFTKRKFYFIQINWSASVDMKHILGTKLNMTQIFKEDGIVVPVTRIQAGPCVVTQVKTEKKDGVSAVQIGFGSQKMFRLTKPELGHLKGLSKDKKTTVRFLRDVRVEENHELKRGDVFTVKTFESGDKIQVMGTAKGRGFQGVVKRHGFHGSPASHGHKDQLRMPGSIGATDAARVFKGTRMGGHMGDNQVTVKNLEIIKVDSENNIIFVKGAVPGARNGLVLITAEEGKIIPEVEKVEEVKTEVVEEKKVEVKEEKPAEKKKEETKKENK
jgi:large subunit ribosomal protein L3